MPSAPLRELVRPMVWVQRVIWASLVSSVILYVAVAWLVTRGGDGGAAVELRLALYGVSVLLALGALAYHRIAHSEPRLESALRREGIPTGAQALPAHEQRLLHLLAHLQTSLIVSLFLAEAVALVGLVLAFLTRRPVEIVPFAAAALLLDALFFPRPEAVLERLESRARSAS